MKKINKLTFLVVLICSFTFNIDNCISQWQQTAGPQGSNIISFYSSGQKTVFAGSFGQGVFRSNNLGAKWQTVNTGLPADESRIVYSFTSIGNYLFAGTEGGIYRSSTNGNSWEPAFTGDDGRAFALISIRVSNINYIFAGTPTGVFKSTDNGNSWVSTDLNHRINALTIKTQNGISLFAVASSDHSIFRSDDLGLTWIDVSNGIFNTLSIDDIIAAGQNIFVGTYQLGVFLSTNNGGNWSPVNTGLPVSSIVTLIYFNNSVYAGTTNGIYKSTNLGGNWYAVNSGFTDSYVNRLYCFAYNFFAGTNAGIYASFNEGKKWESVIDGLPYFNVTCVAAKKNLLFAGSDDGGVSYSDNNANTWHPINKGCDIHTNMIGIKGNTIFKGTRDGISRSINNGKEWIHTNFYGTENDSYSFAFNNTYTFAGDYYHYHLGFHGSLLRSDDDGLTWTEVINQPIIAIAVNNANIFAGRPYTRHNSGYLYRSTNNGNDWVDVLQDNITSLALKGITIFAGTGENGIFRSTDNGNTWNQFNNALTDTSIIALVYTTNENRVFAATTAGIFYTTVNGTKWYKTSASFVGENITSLATDNDFIYAGLNYNGGVWRYSLAKMNAPVFALNNETPLRFSVSQNYPNPFNPVTNIKFEIAKLSDVKITVYNVLGREVVTPVDESLQPGTYEVTFDGSNLPSGVYFYRLITDGFSETRKMLMIK